MLALLRPRNVMPVHGEFRMLAAHAAPRARCRRRRGAHLLAENGSVVELADGRAEVVGHRVERASTFVDGLGVGDVQDVVAPRPAPALGGRRTDRRRDHRAAERSRGRGSRGDRARLCRARRSCWTRRATRRPSVIQRLPRRRASQSSSSSRSTCTTRWASWHRAHRPAADDPPGGRRGLGASSGNRSARSAAASGWSASPGAGFALYAAGATSFGVSGWKSEARYWICPRPGAELELPAAVDRDARAPRSGRRRRRAAGCCRSGTA